MKPGSFLVVALLIPAFFCSAQDKPNQEKPNGDPATGASSALSSTSSPTQSGATPTAPDAAKQPMDDTYVIGEYDSITILVWKEEGFTDKNVLVRPDGMISLPLIGDIKASGKTPMQLAKDVEEQLKKYIQDPNVTVSLNQMNSKKVYFMGEIGKQGPILMTPGMTLLEAIGSAGGLSPFANSKKIYILRNVDGKLQKIFVQYKLALKGDLSKNLTLNPGDTIVVP
jgi:polysaccharide export outer membrane protein